MVCPWRRLRRRRRGSDGRRRGLRGPVGVVSRVAEEREGGGEKRTKKAAVATPIPIARVDAIGGRKDRGD